MVRVVAVGWGFRIVGGEGKAGVVWANSVRGGMESG